MEEKMNRYYNFVNPIFNEISLEIKSLGNGIGLDVETSIVSPCKIKVKYKASEDPLLIGFKQLVLECCERYRVLAVFEEV